MDLVLIVLIILSLILALIAAFLLVPVDITIKFLKEGPVTSLSVVFRVLWGFATGDLDFGTEKKRFRLRILAIKVYIRDLEEREKRERRPVAWGKILDDAGELYDAFMGLINALLRHTSLKEIGGEVKIGMPNPSLTGMLSGFLYAGNGIASTFSPKVRLRVESCFEREMLDAEVGLRLRTSTIWLIAPLIRLFRRMRSISA